MGKKKKSADLNPVVAEFNISMYCNACERSIAKIISKLEGVETFTTDMNNHKVVVTGKIDPEKVLKKLKKKTGKRVEIVGKKEEIDDHDNFEENSIGAVDQFPDSFMFEFPLMMFSDENPNACFVM